MQINSSFRLTKCIYQQVIVLLCVLVVSPPALALEAVKGTVKEFHSPNRNARMTISVQVWGDVELTGIHHIPDNTHLIQLLGYVGGPKGKLDLTTVHLKRNVSLTTPNSRNIPVNNSYRMSGQELLRNPGRFNLPIQEGDIIYIDVKKERDELMENLTFISVVTGVISSLALTYILIRDFASGEK